jgi:hypothetical protein
VWSLRFSGPVLLLLANIALSAAGAEAHTAWDLSYVPVGHWSYQIFDRLASLGFVPLDAITARPITRREARRLIGEALSHARTADSEIVRLAEHDLQRLRQEFSVDFALEIQGRGLAGNPAPEFTPNRFEGISSAAAGLALHDDWLLSGSVVGGDSPGDPPAGEIYTAFQLGSVSFQLGRTSSSWGPSLRTALFLSDNAGTLPLLRLTADLPQARLTKVVASLERSGGSPPGDIVLIATRLDWMVTPRFRLGFNEAVVTTPAGRLSAFDFLEPIPVLWGIIGGYELHDLLGQARDTTAAVDIDWLIRPGVKLYGTGFVNDALDRIAERLARIGITGGLYFADPFKTGRTSLRLEYSAVTNGTYSYPNATELAYAYRGRSLGAWFGPDGDALYLELTHTLNPFTDLQLSYAYARHGAGRIGQPAPPPSDWFLSGAVEYRQTLGLQLQTIHSPFLETRYRAEIASVTNQGNVAGANGWEWRLGYELTYKWPALSTEVPEEVRPAEPGPPQEGLDAFRCPPSCVAVRQWASTMTSSGPLAGPMERANMIGLVYRVNMGEFAASLSYDAGDAQAFWSADLHHPLARLQHGTVSVFAGWGGLTRHGALGGTIQDLTLSGPRLGAEFFYQLAPAGKGTPLYFVGQLSSPLLRGIWAPLEGGAPFFYWTYEFGAGWQFQSGWRLEAGYRGAVAVWRDLTPNKTILYWDGLYLLASFQ